MNPLMNHLIDGNTHILDKKNMQNNGSSDELK